MSLSHGAQLGPYEILSPLGQGGMGQVYKARHRKLERDVAIKVLPDEVRVNRERLARFEREARLASSLNHPNIITIYDIGEHETTTYIAMELVDGLTLRRIIAQETLPLARALDIAIQIGDGLAKAHAAGIVHRDLKPENVMVTGDGIVKILDFGLAKDIDAVLSIDTASPTEVNPSIKGAVVGTPRYMSPEQIGGLPLDHRSDQFAFGILLYEMLAGKPPFDGPSITSIVTAISRDPAPPLAPLRRDIPAPLARLVDRCLAKNPGARYESTADVCRELHAIKERIDRPRAAVMPLRALILAAAIVAMVSGLGVWMWFRGGETRWAEHDAIPQIAALIDKGSVFEAYRLAMRAKRAAPRQPDIEKLLGRISIPAKFVTVPPGAEVSMKGYDSPDAPWEPLGITPLETRIPYALMRLQVRKEGFETFEGAPFGGGVIAAFAKGMTLEPAGSRPPGMVKVFANSFAGRPQNLPLPGDAPAIAIGDFWIDRTEVTNREFKRFVDAGGYRQRKYWIDAFPMNGGEDAWNAAIQSFKDATGRTAPATWSLASYPDGAETLPVGGVSWYEAAAYCRYAGKTLPTIYHWSSAVGQHQFSDILRLSNFDASGPAPVGKFQGLAGYGALDMAGNVAEWCWNASPDGRRHLLGGAWSDPGYVFLHAGTRPADERTPTHGFRCVTYAAPPGAPLLAPVDTLVEVRRLPPVSDEVFEAYRAMYAYERTPLNATIEKTDESSPYWKKEVVSFDAAYGNDRVIALVFLPRNARPPFQAVIWVPGADAFAFHSSETLAGSYLFDFIPRTGRALVYLIYDGIYERSKPQPGGALEQRDMVIRWSKDFSRTVDYLETRNDIDTKRLAYYGLSSTAILGPLFTTVDGRIRASMLIGGGFMGTARRPESAPPHFASRCRIPTLILNGTDDFILPYAAQTELYERLGTPPEHKRLARLEGGHIPADRLAIMREVLDWLDKYLGPVETGDVPVTQR